MCEKKIHTPFSSGGPVGSSEPSRPPGREIIISPLHCRSEPPVSGAPWRTVMPLLPREGWHITACQFIRALRLELYRALAFRPTWALSSPLSVEKRERAPMTLTLQRRPCSRSREKRGLRFLGTVPETDVLVVTHKRNMRSKFR